MRAEDLVDLDRYPLFDPAERARIIARARHGLEELGSAILPGFLRPAAVTAMAAEAAALIPHAHRRDRMLGAYDVAPGPGMAEDHPLRRVAPYRMRVVATDQLDPDGCILPVYEWDPLTRLVADILGLPVLHLVADRLTRCNLTILGNGDEHGWHFDRNDFVVSLLIQKPENGGIFEFAPNIRDEGAEDFDRVGAVMDGRSDAVRRLDAEPGTLALFQGRRSLHRVTCVGGARPRIIALFSYDKQPDMVFGPDAQRRVFGRTESEPPVP